MSLTAVGGERGAVTGNEKPDTLTFMMICFRASYLVSVGVWGVLILANAPLFDSRIVT